MEGPLNCMNIHPRKALRLLSAFGSLAVFLLATQMRAQDWVHTGTNLGNDRIRIAAADFKPVGADPQTPALKAAFDATLYSDLANAGIFDLVSKSLAPQATPGSPQEINLAQWSAAPANAAMVAFGSLSADNGRLIVYGWLFDTRNTTIPQVLGKQYNEAASQDMARTIAHRFADEIILRLGGGINGICRNQDLFRQLPQRLQRDLGDGLRRAESAARSRTWAPFRSRRASRRTTRASLLLRWAARAGRSACTRWNWTGWSLSRPARRAAAISLRPGRATARKIAFSSSRSGDSEIWVADASGGNLRRITSFRGPDVAPTWNPRTNAQMAWVSGRTGEPQIYTMDQDGANVQRMTDGGYAISPSWSPNGQFLTFSWNRKYGPGDPGGVGHPRDGHRQQALAAAHPRSGQQRLSLLGAGRSAHRLRADHRRHHRRSGRCWPTAPSSINSPTPATTSCPTGAGSEQSTK